MAARLRGGRLEGVGTMSDYSLPPELVTLAESVATLAESDAAKAARAAFTEARRSAREVGLQSARDLAELAEEAIGDEGLQRMRKALGVDTGGDAVCDYCSAPFVHGPALQPAIKRLEALDRCPEEGQLRQAHERLRQFDLELPNASAALATISKESIPADLGANVRAAVASRVACEAEHDAKCERDTAAVRAQGEAGRVSFMEGLAKARESDAE